MNASDIFYIHEYLTEYFVDSEDPIEPPGVKNKDMIYSAAARPDTSAGGVDAYPGVFDKASALFHSIISNHAFHNGNKRAALLSTMYYLGEQNYWLENCSDDEMYDFTRQVAAHELCEDRRDEIPAIAEWLQRKSRRRMKGERILKLQDLKDILSNFGFSISDNGKLIDIYKGEEYVTNILRKGAKGAEDYDGPYIAELRKRLELTPEEGIDSARFYGQKGMNQDLGELVDLRVEVMKKLAKI